MQIELNEYVGYLRVSTKKQGISGLGIEDQKLTILRTVKNLGGTVIKWFEEHETATPKRIRITQNEARHFCRTNKAIFISARLDRFARDYDFCRDLFSSNEPFVFCDCLSANALELKIKAAFAEEEADKISKNTRNALAILKAKGIKLGNPQNFSEEGRFKGGQTTKLMALTNPENRKAIGFVKSLLQNKNSYSKIAEILNQSGYKTRANKNFTKNSVFNLIKLYKGYEQYMYVT